MSQLCILLSLFIIIVNSSLRPAGGCYTSIFSFGDSLTDTGNLMISGTSHPLTHLPYGETYFHHATGRCSDGRLIVDFIAQAAGLPLLPPYLGEHKDFKKGVNFAVAGATALQNNFFWDREISVTWTNYSLSVQLAWFEHLLPSLCSSVSECQDMLRNALFLMGEIGGNDYNHPLVQGRSLEELRTIFVPSVMNAISSVITAVIELGAITLLVPGNFPIGCLPLLLDLYASSNPEDYDEETGCIKRLNDFSVYHNQLLIQELDHLRKMHPHATIIYADYYEAAMTIFRSPEKYGFNERPLMVCCGGGGLYNYNASCICGKLGSTACRDPSRYISWDGEHLTEAAYKFIATGLLQGKYTRPPHHLNLFSSRKNVQYLSSLSTM